MKAAKEKTFLLLAIMSALFVCAPAIASSERAVTSKTRAELFLLEGQNRVGWQAIDTANRVENYDPPWGVASESLVAPRAGAGLLDDVPRITNKFPNDPIPVNGKLFGEATITNGRISLPGRAGGIPRNVDFVITADGRLLLGSKHHFLSQGTEVVAAGELKIVNGQIKLINNKSGHFRPTVVEAANFPDVFRSLGLDLKGAHFESFRFTFDSQGIITSVTRAVREILE